MTPERFLTSIARTVTRDELLESRLKDAADEFCDGRAAPLVLALVQGNRFSAAELARLRRLLDEAGDRPFIVAEAEVLSKLRSRSRQ